MSIKMASVGKCCPAISISRLLHTLDTFDVHEPNSIVYFNHFINRLLRSMKLFGEIIRDKGMSSTTIKQNVSCMSINRYSVFNQVTIFDLFSRYSVYTTCSRPLFYFRWGSLELGALWYLSRGFDRSGIPTLLIHKLLTTLPCNVAHFATIEATTCVTRTWSPRVIHMALRAVGVGLMIVESHILPELYNLLSNVSTLELPLLKGLLWTLSTWEHSLMVPTIDYRPFCYDPFGSLPIHMNF